MTSPGGTGFAIERGIQRVFKQDVGVKFPGAEPFGDAFALEIGNGLEPGGLLVWVRLMFWAMAMAVRAGSGR